MMARLVKAQQLDTRAVAGDEPRLEHDVTLDLHQLAELGSNRVRLDQLESQPLAIKAQRPLEVGHTDTNVRECHYRGGGRRHKSTPSQPAGPQRPGALSLTRKRPQLSF